MKKLLFVALVTIAFATTQANAFFFRNMGCCRGRVVSETDWTLIERDCNRC